jgi:hypothetical protein
MGHDRLRDVAYDVSARIKVDAVTPKAFGMDQKGHMLPQSTHRAPIVGLDMDVYSQEEVL